MKKNKRFVFIVTCMIFVINYSAILGSGNLNRKLNIFINENNLSHEEIKLLITELNHIDTENNRLLKKSLKRISRLKEKEKHGNSIENRIKYRVMKIEDSKKLPRDRQGIDENLSILSLKNSENFLRKRE